ncbi:MAG TPA: DUF1800 family protein, partial [Terriglobales bacterium]
MFRKALPSIAILCALAVSSLNVNGRKHKPKAQHPPAIPQMSEDQKVLYAQNRLAYGPRPGDVGALKKIGVNRWIEQQLHPESIPENPKLLAKLQPLETLALPAARLIESYPPPQLVRAMVQGRAALP